MKRFPPDSGPPSASAPAPVPVPAPKPRTAPPVSHHLNIKITVRSLK